MHFRVSPVHVQWQSVCGCVSASALIKEGHCMTCPIPPAQAGSKAVLPYEGSGRLPKGCGWSCGDLGFPSIRTVWLESGEAVRYHGAWSWTGAHIRCLCLKELVLGRWRLSRLSEIEQVWCDVVLWLTVRRKIFASENRGESLANREAESSLLLSSASSHCYASYTCPPPLCPTLLQLSLISLWPVMLIENVAPNPGLSGNQPDVDPRSSTMFLVEQFTTWFSTRPSLPGTLQAEVLRSVSHLWRS